MMCCANYFVHRRAGLTGIAKNIVAIGPVLAEVQILAFENSDQVGEFFHHLFAAAEFPDR